MVIFRLLFSHLRFPDTYLDTLTIFRLDSVELWLPCNFPCWNDSKSLLCIWIASWRFRLFPYLAWIQFQGKNLISPSLSSWKILIIRFSVDVVSLGYLMPPSDRRRKWLRARCLPLPCIRIYRDPSLEFSILIASVFPPAFYTIVGLTVLIRKVLFWLTRLCLLKIFVAHFCPRFHRVCSGFPWRSLPRYLRSNRR